MIVDDYNHWYAITLGIMKRHGSMLQTDSAIHECIYHLTGCFEIALRQGPTNTFVVCHDELRLGISAVVNNELLKSVKERTRI